jgi:hypothetical protein
MARIKIDSIIDHLGSEVRRALEDSFQECVPDAHVDSRRLFRLFKRNLQKRCMVWETIPEAYVEKS